MSINRHQFVTMVAAVSLGKQSFNNHFRLFVVAFAELMMSNMPLRIDEIERGPIVVVKGTPYCIIVINRDGIINFEVVRFSAHVSEVVLKAELRRMHADYDQSLILVFLHPRPNV